VFASANYNTDVYSLAVDANQGKVTGMLQRLTQDTAVDWLPSISMDGTRLLFASERLGGDDFWTKDLKTGKEASLMRPEDTGFISPDGSLVVVGGGGPILVVPFHGGAARRVCEDCKYVSGWSPDGTKILFYDHGPHGFVGVLDLASGQKTILTNPKLSVFPQSFSPDGRWIAVQSENPVRSMIVPFRPGQSLAEADWIPLTNGPGRDTSPQWSPDGNLLYFTSDRDGLVCIWAQRLDPVTKRAAGKPFAVHHLHGALLRMRSNISQLSLARDKLAFSLEERAGNIWMLK